MDTLLRRLRSVLYAFSIAAMSVMLIVTFGSVVTRYVFHFTFEWAEELSRFLFAWSVFLGAALILGENGHLAVELLTNKLKGTIPGLVLEAVVQLCSYIFTLLLLVQGWKMTTMMMFQTSPGLGVPMGIVYAVIPLSACLMLLYMFKGSFIFVCKLKTRADTPKSKES